MNVSQKGLDIIKKWEGCRLTAYQDSVGVWTIGWGTTNSDMSITGTEIKKGLKISQATADEWLEKSVNKKYAPKVNKYGKYNFNQNQFDALVSFCYNIGSIDQLTANWTRSIEEISNHIPAYNKAGGKVLQGLVNRRKDEKALFDKIETESGDEEMKKYINGSTPERVYADVNCLYQVGTLNPREECDCLGIFNNRAIVRYKVNNTDNFKVGFVTWLDGVQ